VVVATHRDQATARFVTLVAPLGPGFVTVSTYVTGCPSVTTAGPLFATPTSALWVTLVVALELLFEAFTSKLLVATTAVFTIVTALPMLSVSVNCAVAPLARVLKEQVTVPPAPADGVTHDAVGPLSWVSETKVVPAGSASVSTTSCAMSGPALETVIV